MTLIKKYLISATIIFGVAFIFGCAGLDGSFNPAASNPNYGSSYGDDYYYRREQERELERERRRREQYEKETRELRKERERLERAQRELQKEQSRRDLERMQEEQLRVSQGCDGGWSPRGSKCSKDERKRGCQDKRAPNGELCVRFR